MKAKNERDLLPRLDRPDPSLRFYLLHGPDESGAQALVERLGRGMGDDVERIDLEAKQLRDRPGILADEAASVSLFGGKRYIRVGPIDDSALEAVTLLLNAAQAGNPVIAIGPTLRTTSKLVKLVTSASNAIVLGCYVPAPEQAGPIAAALARDLGIRLSPDAAQRLARASGGDRAVIAREVEKIALYCDAAPDRPADAGIEVLEAIGADLSGAELNALVDTILQRRGHHIGAELRRLEDAGTHAVGILRALTRRFTTLAQMRAEIDAGESVQAVVKRHRVHFREEARTEEALRNWSSARLARVIARAGQAERAVTRSGTAGEVLASWLLTELAGADAR